MSETKEALKSNEVLPNTAESLTNLSLDNLEVRAVGNDGVNEILTVDERIETFGSVFRDFAKKAGSHEDFKKAVLGQLENTPELLLPSSQKDEFIKKVTEKEFYEILKLPDAEWEKYKESQKDRADKVGAAKVETSKQRSNLDVFSYSQQRILGDPSIDLGKLKGLDSDKFLTGLVDQIFPRLEKIVKAKNKLANASERRKGKMAERLANAKSNNMEDKTLLKAGQGIASMANTTQDIMATFFKQPSFADDPLLFEIFGNSTAIGEFEGMFSGEEKKSPAAIKEFLKKQLITTILHLRIFWPLPA